MIVIELQHIFSRFADSFLASHAVHPEGIKAVKDVRSCRTAALGGHLDQCDCLRRYENFLQLVPEPELSEMRKLEKGTMDLRPDIRATSRLVFSYRFYRASRVESLIFGESEADVYASFQGGIRDAFQAGAGSEVSGCSDWRDDGVAYLGAESIFSSPCPLHCARRRSFAFRLFICAIQEKILYPCSGALQGVSRQVSFLVEKGFSAETLHFTGNSLDEVSPSFSSLLDSLYEKDWVVYCKKPFKTPHHVVRYLSRYTHKTAIYNNRLDAMDEETVTFRYRDYKDGSRSNA